MRTHEQSGARVPLTEAGNKVRELEAGWDTGVQVRKNAACVQNAGVFRGEQEGR